jgi:dienelactone hydrolase
VLAVAAAGFVLWASNPARPDEAAIAALASDSSVGVESGQWIEFRPIGVEPNAGLVIYPGGLVDARAYTPAAHTIAAQGYLVAIVPMPLNLAVFAPDRARDVIAAHPEIKRWAVGGHSLGGSMAASFANGHPDLVRGLVLWASYPAQWDDLSRSGLAVVSIHGSRDGLSTGDKIAASRPLLPPETVWVEIRGGNHAQFGSYGIQSGDNPAEVDWASQQAQAVAATVSLLKRIAR